MPWRFLRALSCPARIIAAVSPLVPLVPLIAGFVALVAGVLVLRTYGPSYRVGRLLASTPEVSVAEAREPRRRPAALRPGQRPDRRRGRVRGRRAPAAGLPPDAAPGASRWRAGSRSRTAGSASSSRSATASRGSSSTTRPSTAGSSSCRANRSAPPPTSPIASRRARHPMTPVRLRIEQVSSIEHAIVLGVPGLDEAGEPRLSAGLGRPLVLTTLEPDEAMRLLTDGESRRPLVAAACLAAGLGLVVIGGIAAVIGAVVMTTVAPSRRGAATVATASIAWLVCASAALAASPSPDADRRRPAQLRPGSRAGRRPAVRAAGGRRHRGRVGGRDARLRAADRATRRLNGLGPSAYWQEL